MKFYLRLEAVNLNNVIEDTADLGTIRGGSLLLLKSVNAAAKAIDAIEPITTGASTGLFAFEAKNVEAARAICERVRQFLANESEPFHFATFVVDVAPADSDDKDFQESKEKLVALNRFRQMRQPTMAIPSLNTDVLVGPCDTDRMRPGVKTGPLTQDEQGLKHHTRISSSVAIRRKHGSGESKQAFYHDMMVKKCDWPDFDQRFVNDFDQLSRDHDQGVLHHKMAVIYADGNHFGKVQNRHCRTSKLQHDFDQEMKANRREMLKSLLKKMAQDRAFQCMEDKEALLRLETLLWGGDELIWVVPAWRAWSVLSHFFEWARQWKFHNETLFHAAGLVFCHHNAPIHGITHLCRTLAEAAKEDNRKQNLFQYLVMESFDHIGQGLDAFRAKQFPGTLADDGFSLKGEEMGPIADMIMQLKQARFPRRKVVAMAHAACQWAAFKDPDGDVYKRVKEQIEKTAPQEAQEALRGLERSGFFGRPRRKQPHALWLHLAQLWDYFNL